MRELRPMEKIFSITNQIDTKVIYFFGLPIRFNSKTFFNIKYKNLPIDNKKILFVNFKGNGYGCNPKYIAEEIINQKLPYNIVWLVKDTNAYIDLEDFPPNIKLVNFKSSQALKELATAKVWVDNQRKIYHIKKGLQKKKGQYYIQTWHGSLGIKKIGLESPLSNIDNEWIPYGIEDSQMIDYIISNSDFEDKVFEKNFWGNGKILKLGHPRNDIFYHNISFVKEKLYKELNLPSDTKIILYVPSFRDDFKLCCYGLEYKNLLKTVTEKFGGKWVLLARMHPNLIQYENQLVPAKDNIIDVSTYSDIQELMVSSDIAITDYSSCIFDFMLSRKPAFIYATDIEDYDTDRGFYYPLNSTPFPVAENNEELMKNIREFNYESYKQKVEEFLQTKGCVEDGKAAEKVVELIKTLMEK